MELIAEERGCEREPLMANRKAVGTWAELEGGTPPCSELKISCEVCKTIQMLVFTSAKIRLS